MDLTIFWRMLAMLSTRLSSAWAAYTARSPRARAAGAYALAEPDADTIPIDPIDLEFVRSSALPECPDTVVSDATALLAALREGAPGSNDGQVG